MGLSLVRRLDASAGNPSPRPQDALLEPSSRSSRSRIPTEGIFPLLVWIRLAPTRVPDGVSCSLKELPTAGADSEGGGARAPLRISPGSRPCGAFCPLRSQRPLAQFPENRRRNAARINCARKSLLTSAPCRGSKPSAAAGKAVSRWRASLVQCEATAGGGLPPPRPCFLQLAPAREPLWC